MGEAVTPESGPRPCWVGVAAFTGWALVMALIAAWRGGVYPLIAAPFFLLMAWTEYRRGC